MKYYKKLEDSFLHKVAVIYRVIEKGRRDLKPLYLKKYYTDLHVWRFKMFRKV
jgi:hypothetical protein